MYHINENNQITPLEYEQSYKDLLVCLCFSCSVPAAESQVINVVSQTSIVKESLFASLCECCGLSPVHPPDAAQAAGADVRRCVQ